MNQNATEKNRAIPICITRYIGTILSLMGTSTHLVPILLAFLKHMSSTYAGLESNTIYTNNNLLRRIAQDLDINTEKINQAISEFVKSGIFQKLDQETYQVTPLVTPKVDWISMCNLTSDEDWADFSLHIDFLTGTITTTIDCK